MEMKDDSLSFWDIRRNLLSAIDFAEEFAARHPEHADAVERFASEVRRIKNELMSSFEGDFMPAPLHDIVNSLTGARALASVLARRQTEKSGALSRFKERLKRAQVELIRKVRPDVYGQT